MDIGKAHADNNNNNNNPRGMERVVEWNGKSVYTFTFLEEDSMLLEYDCHEHVLIHDNRGI
eukprot:1633131-Prorocentrum_lima.AAC.1